MIDPVRRGRYCHRPPRVSSVSMRPHTHIQVHTHTPLPGRGRTRPRRGPASGGERTPWLLAAGCWLPARAMSLCGVVAVCVVEGSQKPSRGVGAHGLCPSELRREEEERRGLACPTSGHKRVRVSCRSTPLSRPTWGWGESPCIRGERGRWGRPPEGWGARVRAYVDVNEFSGRGR